MVTATLSPEQPSRLRSCHFCGATPADEWVFQGHPTLFCYDCWESLIGTGDEEPDAEDTDDG